MMNKATRITFIVILSILVVLLTSIFILILKNGSFSFLNFRFSGKESKELVLDQTYDTTFEKIDINTEAGNVYVKNTNDENIRVIIYGEKDNSKVEDTTDILKITGNTKKCSFICINNEVARIEVYLPNNYDKNVNITNDVGDIKIENFENNQFNVQSDTGDINIDYIKSADIRVHTGDVKINKIDTLNVKSTTGDVIINEVNELTVSTTTGDIEINKVNNYIDSSSTTGDVTIDNLNLTKDSKITCTTGDVLIKNTNEIYIETHTSVGDSNINNNYRTAEFILNIRTTTGDIDVKN